MATRTYTVSGMTCGHCTSSVTEQTLKIPGVTDVTIDLDTKKVTVTGENFTDEQVAAAIDEAGFDVD